MATTIIQKRTRTAIDQPWSDWSNLPVDSVTDGTFADTDLVQYRVDTYVQATDITNATVVTNGISNGDGIFDIFMNGINLQIESDFALGRLTGPDYATVRLGSMQSALQNAIQLALQKDKVEYELKYMLPAQTALVERQTKGFDDDARQKVLKQMLDSWSVAYSVAKDANAIPDTIKVNPIDSVTKEIFDALAITKMTNPLEEA